MKLNDFLQKKAWKHWDKSQWSILILAGILLMVLAIPTKEKKDEADTVRENTLDAAQTADAKEDYRKDMEVRLKKALSKIAGAGEVEVMILAQEQEADLIILDDNAAKKTAKYLGLTVTGTLGVLVKAKRQGIIEEVRPILSEMRQNGFYISRDVERMVLNQAGEAGSDLVSDLYQCAGSGLQED